MEFKTWLKTENNIFVRKIQNIPFNVGNQQYIFNITLKPTHLVFPYSSFGGGDIAEICFYPSSQQNTGEDKWNRTGNNSFGDVRQLFAILPDMVNNWVQQNKPIGFFWKGNDKKLDMVWNRIASKTQFEGYVKSKSNSRIYVQQNLQQFLDTVDI